MTDQEMARHKERMRLLADGVAASHRATCEAIERYCEQMAPSLQAFADRLAASGLIETAEVKEPMADTVIEGYAVCSDHMGYVALGARFHAIMEARKELMGDQE